MSRDRLFRESESNVASRVTESDDKDSYEVAGRGELQLGVLIETMRREGFELSISRPRVIFREAEGGAREEHYETVQIDVDEEHSGTAVEKMSRSEEHTSALQSLMRNSYAVLCMKKKIVVKDTTKTLRSLIIKTAVT